MIRKRASKADAGTPHSQDSTIQQRRDELREKLEQFADIAASIFSGLALEKRINRMSSTFATASA